MKNLKLRLIGGLAGVILLLTLAAPLAAAQTTSTRELEFWPKRLSADSTPLLTVQLAKPERQAHARLECGDASYELGPATWSHGLGHVHAFDVEFSAPRARATCAVRVTGRSGREYLSHKPLALRHEVPALKVRRVLPDAAPEGSVAPLEISGQGFDELVDVIWVATDRFETHTRSARSRKSKQSQSVILPNELGRATAAAGEYLVVVENGNHTAAVYGDHFVVEPVDEPEILRSGLAEADGKTFVTVTGFGLDGLTDVRLALPAGNLPLTFERVEGEALETVRVQLPPHSVTNLASAPDMFLDDGRLTLRLAREDRLTHAPPETPPSRD